MDREEIYALTLLKSSKIRFDIFKCIAYDIKIPSEIAEDTSIQISNVSRCLKELKELDLVECINEESKKGRLYRLTEKGITIFDKI